MFKQKTIKFLAALALLCGLQACSDDTRELTAAPLGERAVLQTLADAYTSLSNHKLAASPSSMPADKRKKFLNEMFTDAGYNYSLTLKLMASKGFDKNNKLHRDMAELVLMPHRNQRGVRMAIDRIYSAEELQDIAVIERLLNSR